MPSAHPIGDTSVPPGTLERGMLLRLRFELDLYVNLRPFTGVPGSIAEGADFAVVRENTEGTYAGEGGFLRKGTPHEVATQGSVNTRMGVERCVRFAFDLAARRPARHLTLVHKTNVLTFAGDLWHRTVTEVAPEHPAVDWDYNHVDAACIYLVEQPKRYDVIVTDNLFGDILTDLAGAVVRRHRLRRVGQSEPGPHGALAVRAGARRRPRHRGQGHRQPVGRHPLGRPHARAPGRGRRRRPHPQGPRHPGRFHVNVHPRAVHHRRGRRHRRKAVAAMPITPTEKIWMDGELVDWADATVHVLTHTMHYGSGVFEGIRAYPTSRGVAVFRLGDHIRRLFASAKIFMIDIPYTVEEIMEATRLVVRANGMHDGCYLRPLVYLGYGEMGLNPLPCPVNVSVAAWPWGTYLGDEGVANGVSVKVSSWRRHDPNAVPTAAKGTGMYVNSSLAKVEAIKAGYDEAILLAPNGTVSECTGENVFIVRDGVILTPNTSDAGALDGITQDSVETIARDLGYELRHQSLIRTDLYLADEAFLTGTAAEVVPIRAVDDRPVGPGHPGRITKEIQQTYFATVRGEVDQYKEWLDHVD